MCANWAPRPSAPAWARRWRLSLIHIYGKRRLYTNPLRVLDTKNPAMQEMADSAPRLFDFLGEESRAHFDGVCQRLTDAGIEYRLNPRLVRGLDYYNLTVFEWVTDRLGSQGTVCGGGRYDGLIELLGGKAAPAVGFAIGMERLLDLWEPVSYTHLGAPWRSTSSAATPRRCRCPCRR